MDEDAILEHEARLAAEEAAAVAEKAAAATTREQPPFSLQALVADKRPDSSRSHSSALFLKYHEAGQRFQFHPGYAAFQPARAAQRRLRKPDSYDALARESLQRATRRAAHSLLDEGISPGELHGSRMSVNRRWLGPGWRADARRDPALRLESAETRTTEELERASLPRVKDEWDGERRRAAARREREHANRRQRWGTPTSVPGDDETLSGAHAAQLRLLEKMGLSGRLKGSQSEGSLVARRR